jgi:HEPN domain-containing protein
MTPERRALALDWLRKADSDLAYARLGIDAGQSYLSGAVYHCHQAAEKALKAILCFHGVIPPKTHDLVRLLEIIHPHGDLSSFQEAAIFLTPLSTEFRYPGDLEEPSSEDASQAFQYAKKIHIRARELMG